MKVYLVTRGSYSDYAVEAVFADRGIADAHRAKVDEANELEEYDLITAQPEQFTVYTISNDTYHGRGVTHEWTYLAWDYNRSTYKRADATEYDRGFHAVRVVGWDQEAVRKSYQDRTAMHEARVAGVAE